MIDPCPYPFNAQYAIEGLANYIKEGNGLCEGFCVGWTPLGFAVIVNPTYEGSLDDVPIRMERSTGMLV